MSNRASSLQSTQTRTDGLMDRFLNPHSFAIPTQDVGRTIYTKDAVYGNVDGGGQELEQVWGPKETAERRWASAGVNAVPKDCPLMRTIYFKRSTKPRSHFFDDIDVPCMRPDGEDRDMDVVSPTPSHSDSDHFHPPSTRHTCRRHGDGPCTPGLSRSSSSSVSSNESGPPTPGTPRTRFEELDCRIKDEMLELEMAAIFDTIVEMDGCQGP